MADPLKPIERQSLTQTEQQRYEAGGNFGLGASKAGKESVKTTISLEERYKSGNKFGMGAKSAGKPGGAATDAIDVGNNLQNEFRINAPVGVTAYKAGALDYASRHYKISTQKYKG